MVHAFLAAPTGPMATSCAFPLVRKSQITCRNLIMARSGKSWMTLDSTMVGRGRNLEILWICEMRHQHRRITLICTLSLIRHCIPHMYTIPFTYFHASRIAIMIHMWPGLRKIAHGCSRWCSLIENTSYGTLICRGWHGNRVWLIGPFDPFFACWKWQT
jgi:hypothetical protein